MDSIFLAWALAGQVLLLVGPCSFLARIRGGETINQLIEDAPHNLESFLDISVEGGRGYHEDYFLFSLFIQGLGD